MGKCLVTYQMENLHTVSAIYSFKHDMPTEKEIVKVIDNIKKYFKCESAVILGCIPLSSEEEQAERTVQDGN